MKGTCKSPLDSRFGIHEIVEKEFIDATDYLWKNNKTLIFFINNNNTKGNYWTLAIMCFITGSEQLLAFLV